MPKKAKKLRKLRKAVRVLRGKGGIWEDVQRGYSRLKDASRTGVGRYVMEAANTALDRLNPAAGGVMRGARRILGWGAYKAAMGGGSKLLASPVPNMHAVGENGVRICHHEYLGDISSSIAFVNTVFQVNPGIQTTFPWLSGVAHSFQKYEFRGLAFYFKSTSAVALNSTNTALGTIIGATQYNDYETTPGNKASMLNIAGATDGRPAEDNVYVIECDAAHRMFKNLLVRSTGVSDDLQKYDIAKFNLATYGSQAAAVIGELHVCYDVILKQPIPAAPFAGPLSACQYSTTGIDDTHALGTAITTDYDYVGLSASADYNTWQIPAGLGGAWQVVYYSQGTAKAVTAPTITLTNGTGINGTGSTGALVSPAPGDTAARLVSITTFVATNPQLPISFTFGSMTLPTTPTYAMFTLTQLNGGVTVASGVKVEEHKEAFRECINVPRAVSEPPEEDLDFLDARVVKTPRAMVKCSRCPPNSRCRMDRF